MANTGITQSLAGQAPGSNFVLRVPINYERDRQAWPVVQVYDNTNAAAITTFCGPRLVNIHSGADDSATLINANGHFPQSLVGAQLYNITDGSSTTITAVSGDFTTCTGVLAGGVGNDWDTNDVYMIVPPTEASWVWCEPFCFELPTVARNGAGADCVAIAVKVYNANSQGALYVHQVELQTNLLDNPGLETGAVADPFVPDGWTNTGMDAGDTVLEATVLHSGVGSLEFNTVAAAAEYMSQNVAATAGNFYGIGGWVYRDAGTLGIATTSAPVQASSATGAALINNSLAAWALKRAVVRASANPFRLDLDSGADDSSGYFDDAYVVALSNVSLTATPASAANSVESGGLRVDGLDVCTAPLTRLRRTKGKIKFKWIPRHSAATACLFGNATPAICYCFGDADDYIHLDWSAANTIRLRYNANGAGVQTGAWDATGAIVAGTTYQMEIRYRSGYMRLYVNGVLRIAIAAAVAFGTIPATFYAGAIQAGGSQVDAVYL